ncbi:MAG: phosphatase domain-containing protein, partial [Cyanobacteriota bacterium]
VSIEPHLGYGGQQHFYVGGKIYNYEGVNWTRNPYYKRPNLILNFKDFQNNFNPNSEGYFWLKVKIDNNINLTYGSENLNKVSVSLSEEQKKRNKNLNLVTEFGLNTNEIEIPFFEPHPKSTFAVITDFDNTITRVRKLGLIEYITTNPKIFKLRDEIVNTYNKIENNINPFFYVTARPNGTYKVVKTIIDENNLPKGPVLARDLGFWFLNRGLSINQHKIVNIENVLNTYPDKKFVLIGDNSKTDVQVYNEIYNKYPDQIAHIFIFNNKKRTFKNSDALSYIKKPQEIIDKLIAIGLLNN